jgi:hypothetical protein
MRRYADGYPDPMESQRHRGFLLWAFHRPERMTLFGVRFMLGYRAGRVEGSSTHAPFMGRIDNDAVPPFVWYGGVQRVPNAYMALDAWERLEKKGVAVVEGPDWIRDLNGLTADPGRRVVGTTLRFDNNRIEGEIVAPARGLVVSNEIFAPGWTATVDGRPTKLVRANYLLRGVPVTAGRHRIAFRYLPRRYPLLIALLLGSLATLAAWAFWPRVVALATRIRQSYASANRRSSIES